MTRLGGRSVVAAAVALPAAVWRGVRPAGAPVRDPAPAVRAPVLDPVHDPSLHAEACGAGHRPADRSDCRARGDARDGRGDLRRADRSGGAAGADWAGDLAAGAAYATLSGCH